MGSFYSRRSTSGPLENVQNSSSSASNSIEEQTGSIYDMDPLSEEVMRYETEFKKTYRKLSNALDSMQTIPCREAALEIISCFRENPNEMGNCMSCMNAYQMCVDEAMKDKTNQFAYEIKT